ncbi:hypothetical protein [Marinicella meishanensis]|uniref:hypothetical protein n=1 Tax=Marinicella meishanensis TaxID=2873263 RepID=UPI001CBE2BC4|nr:hypothetical protein [Marinicella sp. NBU2979]
MKKNRTTLTLVTATLLLSACGESHPELTHFKAFDERFTTVLDTEDPEQLKEIAAMFYNRQDVDDVQADLSFDYLFDLTLVSGTQERWRCTRNGYCQQRVQGAEPLRDIYYVERYKELFELSNLN